MRHSATLAVGLMRDPAMIAALMLLVIGAAMVAAASRAIVWRARFAKRVRAVAPPLQTQPSST
jgi:hypothetical protein